MKLKITTTTKALRGLRPSSPPAALHQLVCPPISLMPRPRPTHSRLEAQDPAAQKWDEGAREVLESRSPLTDGMTFLTGPKSAAALFTHSIHQETMLGTRRTMKSKAHKRVNV